jgi:hypothetical protein
MRTKFMYRNDTYIVSSQKENVYTGKKENGRKIATVKIDPFNGQALAV